MRQSNLRSSHAVAVIASDDSIRQRLTSIFEDSFSTAVHFEYQNITTSANVDKGEIGLFLVKISHQESQAPLMTRSIREIYGPSPAICLICDAPSSDFDESYFQGADAIFVEPVEPDVLKSAVSTIYAESIESSAYKRRFKRKRVCRARVTFGNEWLDSKGFAMNFSVGGMFVGSMEELPSRDQKIKFTLSFKEGDSLSGHASVKWTRPEMRLGRPRGFGAEFQGFDPNTLEKLRQFIERP